MKFVDHFNTLKIPLKETSKIFVSVFIAIAESFDTLWDFSISILESHFLAKSSDARLFAEERGIEKIAKEEPESYHNRVLNAYSFLKNSPTKQGIENIIASFTSKKFEIREIYKDDFILDSEQEILEETTILSDDASNFYFVVGFKQALTVAEKYYLEEIIELYKPAHIGFHLSAQILDDFILDDENEELEKNTYLEQ